MEEEVQIFGTLGTPNGERALSCSIGGDGGPVAMVRTCGSFVFLTDEVQDDVETYSGLPDSVQLIRGIANLVGRPDKYRHQCDYIRAVMNSESGCRGQLAGFIRLELVGEEVEKDERHLGIILHGHEDRIPEVKSHIWTSRLVWLGKKYKKK